jgi:SUKH-3 immunity protein/YwqJ-like deaminase
MISRAEAEAVAEVWAGRDAARLGRPVAASVVEFDAGYLVRSAPTADGPPMAPGELTPTVVDRATGETTRWPAVPDAVVQERYRAHRAGRSGVVRTADPAVQLRRDIRRSGLPATVSHLSTPVGVVTARGAKGDQELTHHRLVREHLRAQDRLTRGAERHAELIVVSDALHEADLQRVAAGLPPIDLASARAFFARTSFENTLVREPGDPAGGPGCPPCETCIRALVHLGVLPHAARSWAQESPVVAPGPLPPSIDATRFAPGVAAALVGAGWSPLRDTAAQAWAALAGLPAFPAAVRALTAVPHADCRSRGPGEALWVRRFTVSPQAARHSTGTLAEFGRVVGALLCPIGVEDGDGILAIDERGRVFALDQAGEWYLGTGMAEALSTLVLGRDAPRVRDDGTWDEGDGTWG